MMLIGRQVIAQAPEAPLTKVIVSLEHGKQVLLSVKGSVVIFSIDIKF